ncbi:hypothetical protein B9Z19DRAFT_1063776 [Tuber borchii]|uniref:C2H2-type domain-containing protein n=1 Tax=Tuber borchii TaxID=42251 RepID=A0A2T6ZX38_TUBBO|nr:hypothetical protein B9Z19DRAFT_1063776 [Tuber borchii]
MHTRALLWWVVGCEVTRKRSSFSLVGHDGRGQPIRLPPLLGNLPLHPEKDGWYSVLGSWNGATEDSNPANQISEVNSENNFPIPVPATCLPRNPHPSFPQIFRQYHRCSGNSIILTCTHNPYGGPHTCTQGRITYEASNCAWSRTFKTKQAFNRHYCARHLNDRVDCPVEECLRVGAHGIKRADNLAAHMLNKHDIPQRRISYGNLSLENNAPFHQA